MILALFCLLLGQGALSYEYHINNANELTQFSKNVNTGTSYSGTTVLLDADIDFSGVLSEQFEPIGIINKYFQGTFDGQGHTISNLAIKSSSEDVGLFGYSEGATIRNVVLDSSCSVVSSYSGYSNVYVGGIIGRCYSCAYTIENVVNMASVTFTGKTSNKLYLGGIAGYLYASNSKGVTVRNCANYGSVTHSGTAGDDSYIGGIVGYSEGYSQNKVFIQNCLNYGTINHSGTSTDKLFIGGILGYAWVGANNIENCVSGGKIVSSSGTIGSIIGYINSGTTTSKYCYWTSDVGCNKSCGIGSPMIYTETSLVSLNETTVDNLNSYSSSWNKWLLNTNNKHHSL